MQERTTFYPDGTLDEVVAEGGVHIERLDKKSWFISCQRKDGSEFCLWMEGAVRMTEEREARPSFDEPAPKVGIASDVEP